MLTDPLDISYCEPQSRSTKDKAPVPPPSVVEAMVTSTADIPGSSNVVSSILQKTLARVEQSDSSSSET
jgi:hypothetical protein